MRFPPFLPPFDIYRVNKSDPGPVLDPDDAEISNIVCPRGTPGMKERERKREGGEKRGRAAPFIVSQVTVGHSLDKMQTNIVIQLASA